MKNDPEMDHDHLLSAHERFIGQHVKNRDRQAGIVTDQVRELLQEEVKCWNVLVQEEMDRKIVAEIAEQRRIEEQLKQKRETEQMEQRRLDCLRDDKKFAECRWRGADGLREYLKSWPSGRHKDEAQTEISRLDEIAREECDWQAACRSGYWSHYRSFCRKYPNSRHRNHAILAIRFNNGIDKVKEKLPSSPVFLFAVVLYSVGLVPLIYFLDGFFEDTLL